MEGLEIGAAQGEVEETAGTIVDETIAYATYAAGPVTVGIQMGDADSNQANGDLDTTAFGIAFAVNDDFSISYGQHEIDYENSASSNQEASGVSFSYTMGSMSFGGAFNQVDNVGGTATTDNEGVELNIGFAF